MSKQNTKWLSSFKVFQNAIKLALDAWVPIALLILGQIVVYGLLNIYITYLNFIGAENVTSFWGIPVQAGLILLSFLFQVFWMVATIRILGEPKNFSLKNIFGGKLWHKYIPALVLSVLLTIAMTVASFLAVIPGIILLVWWSMAIYILILEDTSVKHAFQKSYQMASGWGWAIFSRLIFMFLISAVIAIFTIVPDAGAWMAITLSLLFSPVLVLFLGLTYQELFQIKSTDRLARFNLSFGKKLLMIVWAIVVLVLFSASTAIGQFVISIMRA